MKKSSIILICLFAITSTFYFSGCKKVNHKKNIYFDIKIDGDRILYIEGKKNFAVTMSSGGCGGANWSTPVNVVKETKSWIRDFDAPSGSGNFGGVTYTTKFVDVLVAIRDPEIPTHILTGNADYATLCDRSLGVDNDSNYQEGFVIYYFDDDAVKWSTDQGTGNQVGSTLKVVEIIDTENFSEPWTIWLEFTCTLYDDNGNSKEVKKGNLRLNFF